MNCDSLACNSPPVRGCCVGNPWPVGKRRLRISFVRRRNGVYVVDMIGLLDSAYRNQFGQTL